MDSPIDYISLLPYLDDDPDANYRRITFQVTNKCNLNCSYCYQTNKGNESMTKSTMQSCIDLLFNQYKENQENTIINQHTKGVTLEFIGGETLINIDTIYYGSQYFIDQCIKQQHPWLTNFSFSLSTNGTLYFTKQVQEYLKEFEDFVKLSITIDGPKIMHDACRKDRKGYGSFDMAIAAFKDYWSKTKGYPNTKITITPDNLLYLHEIYKFFTNIGCKVIIGGPIFEHKWTQQEATQYYFELKSIADSLLKNPSIYTSLFYENLDQIYDYHQDNITCGAFGQTISFDPNGIAYPCLRFMNSSLKNPISIGNINSISPTSEWLKKYNINLTMQNNQCSNCNIHGMCPMCAGWNYKSEGAVNIRNTNVCWIYRAGVLISSYYWNKTYIQNHINKRIPVLLNEEIALQIIPENELKLLMQLAK